MLQELLHHSVRLGPFLDEIGFDLVAKLLVRHAGPGVAAYRHELGQVVVPVEVQQRRESLRAGKVRHRGQQHIQFVGGFTAIPS